MPKKNRFWTTNHSSCSILQNRFASKFGSAKDIRHRWDSQHASLHCHLGFWAGSLKCKTMSKMRCPARKWHHVDGVATRPTSYIFSMRTTSQTNPFWGPYNIAAARKLFRPQQSSQNSSAAVIWLEPYINGRVEIVRQNKSALNQNFDKATSSVYFPRLVGLFPPVFVPVHVNKRYPSFLFRSFSAPCLLVLG